MKTKFLLALLCAMCIGFIGCKSSNKNEPSKPSEEPTCNVTSRVVDGYLVFEATYADGHKMWFVRFSELNYPTEVRVTSHTLYYSSHSASLDYQGDVIVPSSITCDGVTYQVTGIQGSLGSTQYSYSSSNAFYKCTKLKTVSLPNTVKYIGLYAFQNSSLEQIVIPSSVNKIEPGTFDNCKQLTSVVFETGSQIKSLSEKVFYQCSALSHVVLPSSLDSLGYCFSGCDSLSTMVMPSTLKYLNDFDHCGLKHIELQSGLLYLAGFSYCKKMTELIIPSSVTTIGQLFQCYGSSDMPDVAITSLPTTPPAFEKDEYHPLDDRVKKIRVPSNSVNAYKDAWPYYKSIIEAI